MTAYYNEIDPAAAAWLRELIHQNMIAPGIVDTRSIEHVRPSDLEGFTQCHFFAGIGVWSYALRLAGWPDDRPVWTASCPCQPFSVSGKKSGFDDERHLWPHLEWLISEYSKKHGAPDIIGEQVASKDAEPWIDLVQADLEALGYAFGCIPFPSAGVGAPHIRDRAYWVGLPSGQRLEGQWSRHQASVRQWQEPIRSAAETGEPGRVAHSDSERRREARNCGLPGRETERSERNGYAGGLADADNEHQRPADNGTRAGDACGGIEDSRAGPTNGIWADADWLFCRDGKWRPVEPGTFPLAHGASARVGRLRGYGNAINAEAAKVWIETVMEAQNDDN